MYYLVICGDFVFEAGNYMLWIVVWGEVGPLCIDIGGFLMRSNSQMLIFLLPYMAGAHWESERSTFDRDYNLPRWKEVAHIYE